MDYCEEMDKLRLEREQLDVKHLQENQVSDNKYRETDILAAKQEMIRRNIEAIISVLKMEKSYRGNDIPTIAEAKLKELIPALIVPA